MKIVIKNDLISHTEEVINIFYGENETYIEEWINNYFNEEIDILRLVPMANNISDIDYFIEISDGIFYLVKKYKTIAKGYLYNSSEKISEKIQSIKLLNFDSTNHLSVATSSNTLWNNINSEINHRIMKQIDHASLFQINMKMESAIKTKNTWTATELVMLQNEITREHKKELYSSIVKKTKKFNKKNKFNNQKKSVSCLPSKTLFINNNGDLEGDNIDLSRFSKSCSLEYQIINKKEKYD